MKATQLKTFIEPDDQTFDAIMRRLGFVSAAIYRLDEDQQTLFLATEPTAETKWPATLAYNSDYTPNSVNGLPIGWVRASHSESKRKLWPKGTNLYFPDQDLESTKVIIAVKNASGKRCRLGEMFGPLEALCGRVRRWIETSHSRSEIAEEHFRHQLSTLGGDLQEMIDHELRTPLSSIAGYLALLKDYETRSDNGENLKKYIEVVSTQTRYAVNALDKLSLSLGDKLANFIKDSDAEVLDLGPKIEELLEEVRRETPQFIHPNDTRKFKLVLRKAEDQDCRIKGSWKLLHMALWEVLKNSVIHSHHGEVIVTLYRSDNRVVVDIEDDGRGVAPGNDDLIFLRFFQEPANMMSRRGKRGLGLGLFIARYITDKHSGDLRYVRHKEKGGLFRFIFPAEEVSEQPQEVEYRLGA